MQKYKVISVIQKKIEINKEKQGKSFTFSTYLPIYLRVERKALLSR